MPERLAILCDYPEEGWLSMDLAGQMLHERLLREHTDKFDVCRVCPPFKRRASLVPMLGTRRPAQMFDRMLNRLRDYPRYLADHVAQFDLFHVADHSYAALVHALPPQRTGVFCHDLDAFNCILDPAAYPRPRWFRAISRHILRGMQQAAIVFHTTDAVRAQIERHGLIDPHKLVKAPLGVCGEFTPEDDDQPVAAGIAAAAERPFVLHVGSCADRKRIDVLLDIFAALRRMRRELRLVKAGGAWSARHRDQIQRLSIGDSIVHLRGLDRRALAWLYRRAGLVLLPSAAEGFGLPLIEALACGAAVLASDIPSLREVGGDAVVYAAVGDVEQWTSVAGSLLNRPATAEQRQRRLDRAACFTWSKHARIVAEAYGRLI